MKVCKKKNEENNKHPRMQRSHNTSTKSVKRALHYLRKNEFNDSLAYKRRRKRCSTSAKKHYGQTTSQRRLVFDYAGKEIRYANKEDYIRLNQKNHIKSNKIEKRKKFRKAKKQQQHIRAQKNQFTSPPNRNKTHNETSFESKNLKQRIAVAKKMLTKLESGDNMNSLFEEKTLKPPIENSKNVAQDNTDDCICIENVIEVITIDDDTPLKANNIPKKVDLVTSTPRSKNIVSNQNIFFVDTTPSPWYQNKLPNVPNYHVQRKNVNKSPKKNANTNDVIVILDDSYETTNKNKLETNARTNENDVIIVENDSPSSNKCDSLPQADQRKNMIFPAPINSDFLSFISDDVSNLECTKIDSNAIETNQKSKKRMIIIDGSNVAFRHSLNREFSVKGIKICIDYFQQRGHAVKAVVPEFRRQWGKSTDPDLLQKLFVDDKIIFVPGKRLNGIATGGYDDRLILRIANDFDGAVVSNDNYRDLVKDCPEFQKIIENRVISFTFCNDFFYAIEDPYGRSGPFLNEIINKT